MKSILRNFILMAVATALMALVLVYYAAYTGPLPHAEDPVAAAEAARRAEATSAALVARDLPADSEAPTGEEPADSTATEQAADSAAQ